MKTLIAASLLLLCAGALRAECVTTVSTVTANVALSTPTVQFKISTTCTDTHERIVPLDQYVGELKESKQATSSQVDEATVRIGKFEEKILEAERIKQAVEAARAEPETEEEPIGDGE